MFTGPSIIYVHVTAPHWHVYGKITSRRAYLQRVSSALPPLSHFPRVRLMPLHPPASPPDHPPTPPAPHPPPPAPARVHPAFTSPPPEQKPIQARCFTPSWHVGQGRWSALGFLGYNLPPPSFLGPAPPPPLLHCVSSARPVQQRGSSTA